MVSERNSFKDWGISNACIISTSGISLLIYKSFLRPEARVSCSKRLSVLTELTEAMSKLFLKYIEILVLFIIPSLHLFYSGVYTSSCLCLKGFLVWPGITSGGVCRSGSWSSPAAQATHLSHGVTNYRVVLGTSANKCDRAPCHCSTEGISNSDSVRLDNLLELFKFPP